MLPCAGACGLRDLSVCVTSAAPCLPSHGEELMEILSLARLKSITPVGFWKFRIFAQRMLVCTSALPKTAEDEMLPEGNLYSRVRNHVCFCFLSLLPNLFCPQSILFNIQHFATHKRGSSASVKCTQEHFLCEIYEVLYYRFYLK